MTQSPSGNPYPGAIVSAPNLFGIRGWVTIPTSSSAALGTPVRGLVVTATGNLGVKLADGSNNNSSLWKVTTASGIIWIQAVQLTSSNTATVLGFV